MCRLDCVCGISYIVGCGARYCVYNLHRWYCEYWIVCAVLCIAVLCMLLNLVCSISCTVFWCVCYFVCWIVCAVLRTAVLCILSNLVCSIACMIFWCVILYILNWVCGQKTSLWIRSESSCTVASHVCEWQMQIDCDSERDMSTRASMVCLSKVCDGCFWYVEKITYIHIIYMTWLVHIYHGVLICNMWCGYRVCATWRIRGPHAVVRWRTRMLHAFFSSDLILICGVGARRDSFACLMQLCEMTHSYVTLLIHTWHGSLICGVGNEFARRDAFECLMQLWDDPYIIRVTSLRDMAH